MLTLPQKALKGDRKAMLALYENNKEQVYGRAFDILADSEEAGKAVLYVFKTIWNEIAKKKALSEDGFTMLALDKMTKYCKKPSKHKNDQGKDTADTTYPSSVDKAVKEIIFTISEPYERERKRNLISGFIGGGAALVMGIVIIAVILSASGVFAGDPNEITHYADIVIEDYGTITVALQGNAAPKTVKNFVKLANKGFYDGLTFHRIMKGFMMQGGCPEGTGGGDSGKHIKGEFSKNGFENNIRHTRGTISMARGEENNSASCQFFIVHEDSLFLDGAYAAFGYVTEGIEVVDKVCTDAKPVDGNGKIPAEAQPVIKSITIRKP